MYEFKKNMASRYGVKSAVVAQRLWDCIVASNLEGNALVREKNCWVRCSVHYLTGHFPFYSTHQIRDALDMLVDDRVIVKGNFNDSHFDHTTWYAFTDYGKFLMTEREGDD